ncbi:sensor histidine kinase [Candidatus Microgenomates bacterium]|jgi:signal transduction histidine kinase|nr:MAG: sensor histidine kinase [Candidatus Microgenomates bacterium]
MTTFHFARLKLTAWYLIIIMALSVLFSLVIYRVLTAEIDRFERAQRFFIERRLQEGTLPLPPGRRLFLFGNGEPPNPQLLTETKQRILTMIILANTGILVITGGLGYFLAGRTLKPIKEMMDEQNRFITDASHELKTPLTSLRSEFEVAMLNDAKMTLKEAKQLIKSGFEEIVELQGLAENLIELTQQSKKRGLIKREEVSLLEIAEAALKKVVPLAKQKHITINNDIDDYILEGENQSLTELFVILLDNAIKYSPQHSKISLSSKKTDHHIRIEITDTGMGIDEKDLPHIFDRFYRADKSRSKTTGYGLGLSIAKQIVETHNGSISAESKPNKGSKFVIKLPLTISHT